MVILPTGITLLLVASALFKRALIPQRIGTTPHCRPCNYNLSGLTPDPSTHLGSINGHDYNPSVCPRPDLESSAPDVRSHAWDEFPARGTNQRLSGADPARFDALLVRLYAARSHKLPAAAADSLLDRFRH